MKRKGREKEEKVEGGIKKKGELRRRERENGKEEGKRKGGECMRWEKRERRGE